MHIVMHEKSASDIFARYLLLMSGGSQLAFAPEPRADYAHAAIEFQRSSALQYCLGRTSGNSMPRGDRRSQGHPRPFTKSGNCLKPENETEDIT